MLNLEKVINRSRERSVKYGIDPHLSGAPESTRLLPGQLAERIAGQQDFYTLAKAQLDSLYRLLQNTGFCMALADRDGYVLYVVGDPDLVEHFKQRRCIPGYRWTERDMGTCAIGLVLEEQIPIFLPGDRMFSALAQKISNAGAPVYAPDGTKMLGVISLSGYSEKMHVHTLGLVRQSAETVTAHLREGARIQELAIQNQYMSALLASNSRGMVTIDKKGNIVQMNERARTLLNLPSGAEGTLFNHCVGENFNVSKYLKEGKPFRAREILTSKDKTTQYASFDPIRTKNKEVVGGLITVIQRQEMIRIAADMTGSRAHFTFDSIIHAGETLHATLHLAKIAAKNTTTVLLCGETGTGKELFAQAIHNESDRFNQPFVALNCGAIPKELLESELFGYEEGAFTGAVKGGRPGKLELADNGTLFLDEIGDMPFDMQVKLLRVLQTGEIQRVGGLRTLCVNLRVISATNVDLKEAVAHNKFREDLYYRICTLKIKIPPLRERTEDILPLARHFLQRHERQLNRVFKIQTPEAELALKRYHWPGNIRQLESAVERAVHLSQDKILKPEDFGISDVAATAGPDFLHSPALPETLACAEKRVLEKTLHYYRGNISKSAASLGVSRPTLYRKMEKYGLEISQNNIKTVAG